MVGFRFREISNPPSLGQYLKECRQQAGVSLEKAAQAINISRRYLEAIEAGNYNQLPGEVYAKSFLKVYTKFLGLDFEKCFALYKSEQKVYTKTKKFLEEDLKKPVERISRFHLVVTPKIVRGVIIGLLVFACLVYLGVKVKAIITPPNLVIKQPIENFITKQSFVEIVGWVEPEAILEINGQQVLADQAGNFNETIDLQPGVNIIELRAQKRHSKETKQYLKVVVVEEEDLDN